MPKARLKTAAMALAGMALAGMALALAPLVALAGPVSQPPATAAGSFTPGAPAYAAGFWYSSTAAPAQVGQALPAGTVRLEPMLAAQAFTIDQLGVLVSTAGATGSQATVYIWGPATTGNRPAGLPLGQCTITGVTSTGFQSCTLASPVALTGNKVYWLGYETNSTASALVVASSGTSANANLWQVGSASLPTLATASSSAGLKLSLSFGNGAHGFGVASDPSTYSPAMIENLNISSSALVFVHVNSVP